MQPVQHHWFLAAVQGVWNTFVLKKQKQTMYHLTAKLISNVSRYLNALQMFFHQGAEWRTEGEGSVGGFCDPQLAE